MLKLKLGVLLISLGLSTAAVASDDFDEFSISSSGGTNIHVTDLGKPAGTEGNYFYPLQKLPKYSMYIIGYINTPKSSTAVATVTCTTTSNTSPTGINAGYLYANTQNLPLDGTYTAILKSAPVYIYTKTGQLQNLVSSIEAGQDNFQMILDTETSVDFDPNDHDPKGLVTIQSNGITEYIGSLSRGNFVYTPSQQVTGLRVNEEATCTVYIPSR